jgi:multidrug efflux pump subunit AcrA (membrane-fusion protein)
LIAQGEQVKEGQKLMRIPNLGKMQVNTRVHEAMVASIRGETRVPKGVYEGIRAAMLVNPDPFTRLVQHHEVNMSAIGDMVRQQGHEYKIEKKGQKANIRVDALAGRMLNGSVRTVAAVASQTDFMSSDVKVYQTLVQIEDDVSALRRDMEPENSQEASRKKSNWILKPDMSAEVTIHIDATPDPVLAIPVQSIVGGAENGGKRKVYVVTPAGTEEREVELGLFNDKMAQVISGLNEDEQVVLNPKVILGDKAKTREEPSSNGNGKGYGGGEGKKGGEKKGKGGGQGGGVKGPKGGVG